MDRRYVDEQEVTRAVLELIFLQVEECFEILRHRLFRRISGAHTISRRVKRTAAFTDAQSLMPTQVTVPELISNVRLANPAYSVDSYRKMCRSRSTNTSLASSRGAA